MPKAEGGESPKPPLLPLPMPRAPTRGPDLHHKTRHQPPLHLIPKSQPLSLPSHPTLDIDQPTRHTQNICISTKPGDPDDHSHIKPANPPTLPPNHASPPPRLPGTQTPADRRPTRRPRPSPHQTPIRPGRTPLTPRNRPRTSPPAQRPAPARGPRTAVDRRREVKRSRRLLGH